MFDYAAGGHTRRCAPSRFHQAGLHVCFGGCLPVILRVECCSFRLDRDTSRCGCPRSSAVALRRGVRGVCCVHFPFLAGGELPFNFILFSFFSLSFFIIIIYYFFCTNAGTPPSTCPLGARARRPGRVRATLVGVARSCKQSQKWPGPRPSKSFARSWA